MAVLGYWDLQVRQRLRWGLRQHAVERRSLSKYPIDAPAQLSIGKRTAAVSRRVQATSGYRRWGRRSHGNKSYGRMRYIGRLGAIDPALERISST